MRKLTFLAERLAIAAPEAKYDTVDNDYDQIVWLSPEIQQPSYETLEQIDIDLIIAKEKKEAGLASYYDSKKYYSVKLYTVINGTEWFAWLTNKNATKLKVYENVSWDGFMLMDEDDNFKTDIVIIVPAGSSKKFMAQEVDNKKAKIQYSILIQNAEDQSALENIDYTAELPSGFQIKNDTLNVDISAWIQ
jgi:hypothetical protein